MTQTLRALSTTQSETLTETVDAVVEVFELAPGVPTLVPAWTAKLPHFLSLQKDGALCRTLRLPTPGRFKGRPAFFN